MSESAGGHHGEETTSHDGEKKERLKKSLQNHHTESQDEGATKEEIGFVEVDEIDRFRQSHESKKCVVKSHQKGERVAMNSDSQSSNPEAKIAFRFASLLQDPRATNVFLLVFVIIGMGGHDVLTEQVCRL